MLYTDILQINVFNAMKLKALTHYTRVWRTHKWTWHFKAD